MKQENILCERCSKLTKVKQTKENIVLKFDQEQVKENQEFIIQFFNQDGKFIHDTGKEMKLTFFNKENVKEK